MAAPEDRVQILKNESSATGGTEEDIRATQLDPNEDAPEVRGIFLQKTSGRDELVYITRDASDNLILRDEADQVEYKLDDLFKSKITAADTTPRWLSDAIAVDGLSKAVVNPGADETVKLTVNGSGNASYTLDINPENMTTQGNQPQHIDANGYSAMEFIKSATYYGSWSHILRRTPTAAMTLNIKFILAGAAGAGDAVRIAAKIKRTADGGLSDAAFVEEKVTAVSVSSGAESQQYAAALTFAVGSFTIGDSIALNIGRDGDEEITPTTPIDDFADRIAIIAANFTVP